MLDLCCTFYGFEFWCIPLLLLVLVIAKGLYFPVGCDCLFELVGVLVGGLFCMLWDNNVFICVIIVAIGLRFWIGM